MSSNDPSDGIALLHLEILTPEAVLYEGDVAWVQVPLHDGLLGIWPGHAPLVGAVTAGQVRYEQDGQEQSLVVTSGVLRVGVERCAILISQTAELTPLPDSDGLGQQIVEMLDETLTDEVNDLLQRNDEQTRPGQTEI